MKYSVKYSGIRRGMHSPDDERIYRADEQRPCAECGELTDWTDIVLSVSVCSEECRYAIATRPRRRQSN